MMYELTYESVAKKGLSKAEIEAILETSTRNNAQNEVTGCLIYYNGRLIQILEGSQLAVQQTFDKIKRDERHHEVHLIAENATKERTFPQWGMAYLPIHEKNFGRNELEQFRRNLQLLADFSKPANVTSILFWKKVKSLMGETPEFDI